MTVLADALLTPVGAGDPDATELALVFLMLRPIRSGVFFSTMQARSSAPQSEYTR